MGKTFQPSVFDETANDAPNSDDQQSGEDCALEESCDDMTNQTSKSSKGAFDINLVNFATIVT